MDCLFTDFIWIKERVRFGLETGSAVEAIPHTMFCIMESPI